MARVELREVRRVLSEGVAGESEAAAARFAELAAAQGSAEVLYASYDSPLGTGYAAITERGLVGIELPGGSEGEFVEHLASGLSPRVLRAPARLDRVRRELDEYFAGRRQRFDLVLDWRLVRPGFFSKVLHETAKVPFGVTSTYGELAARAGNPRAHRAAGTALGRNPIPLVVPCHRILRSGGEIGNYGGGTPMKEFLLRLEGAIGDR